MSDLQSLLDGVKALGIAGGPVFAVLWWLERIERKACQKDTRDLLVQTLTTTSQAANSVTEVSKAVAEMADGARDTAGTLSQLGQLIRSLGAALRRSGA